MTEPLPAAPESREIRVFLSSTFRDFNEERKLLATEVFPELNRKARERIRGQLRRLASWWLCSQCIDPNWLFAWSNARSTNALGSPPDAKDHAALSQQESAVNEGPRQTLAVLFAHSRLPVTAPPLAVHNGADP